MSDLFAEELKAANRAAQLWEETAVATRAASARLRTLQQQGGLLTSVAVNVEKKILEFDRQAIRMERAAADARGFASKNAPWTVIGRQTARTHGCFVAGTPVWMADGTTKAIERVKVGDLMLSKHESSGEVAAKRVTHTSIRPDIWTLKLHFEDGSVLETTDEHPLYVEGRGFLAAKEAGVGTSIVTRAGPAQKVVQVERDVRQATVYNFTVADFHTYFVGQTALWVHNADQEH